MWQGANVELCGFVLFTRFYAQCTGMSWIVLEPCPLRRNCFPHKLSVASLGRARWQGPAGKQVATVGGRKEFGDRGATLSIICASGVHSHESQKSALNTDRETQVPQSCRNRVEWSLLN